MAVNVNTEALQDEDLDLDDFSQAEHPLRFLMREINGVSACIVWSDYGDDNGNQYLMQFNWEGGFAETSKSLVVIGDWEFSDLRGNVAAIRSGMEKGLHGLRLVLRDNAMADITLFVSDLMRDHVGLRIESHGRSYVYDGEQFHSESSAHRIIIPKSGLLAMCDALEDFDSAESAVLAETTGSRDWLLAEPRNTPKWDAMLGCFSTGGSAHRPLGAGCTPLSPTRLRIKRGVNKLQHAATEAGFYG